MLTRLEGKFVEGYKRKKLSLNATVSDLDDTSQSAESEEMEYEEIPGMFEFEFVFQQFCCIMFSYELVILKHIVI